MIDYEIDIEKLIKLKWELYYNKSYIEYGCEFEHYDNMHSLYIVKHINDNGLYYELEIINGNSDINFTNNIDDDNINYSSNLSILWDMIVSKYSADETVFDKQYDELFKMLVKSEKEFLSEEEKFRQEVIEETISEIAKED